MSKQMSRPRGLVSIVNSAIERLEPLRWLCFALCSAALLVQLTAMVALWSFLNRELWLWLLVQAAGLLALLLQLRKRRSLAWRARRCIKGLRGSGTFSVSKFARSILQFKTLPAVFSLWVATALLICPFYIRSESSGLFRFSRTLIGTADSTFFAALWQVQATILGVFLVILTFVFQFVSLRRAYETSLLPFLAERASVKEIILFNFCFVLVEMLPVMLSPQNRFLLTAKYFALLGLIFSVLSAAYLLLRILDLLRPEMIEENLTELIKRDLAKELEQEQFLEIAAGLLAETCSSCGLEYSEMDFLRNLPAIRSKLVGKIVDIDLNRLTRFGKKLGGVLPSAGAHQRKCLIVAMLSDELTKQRNVLARISSKDRTTNNERPLGRAFKVEAYGDD